MTEKLKPCPFCGGTAKVFAFNNGGICVKCMTCHCQTFAVSDGNIANAKSYSAYERVIDAWNRRPESEEKNNGRQQK